MNSAKNPAEAMLWNLRKALEKCDLLTAELAKKDAEIAHLQQDCQTEAATVVMLTAERDSLAEDLRDEKQRGLALLADAKEWQAQLAKVEADLSHTKAERDSWRRVCETITAERDALADKVVVLREALQESLRTLDDANSQAGGPIADTIWYSEIETLFDYMGAALEQTK
jgi:chromosome segregation ATPase